MRYWWLEPGGKSLILFAIVFTFAFYYTFLVVLCFLWYSNLIIVVTFYYNILIVLVLFGIWQAELEDDIRQLLDIKDKLEGELRTQSGPGAEGGAQKEVNKLKVCTLIGLIVYDLRSLNYLLCIKFSHKITLQKFF